MSKKFVDAIGAAHLNELASTQLEVAVDVIESAIQDLQEQIDNIKTFINYSEEETNNE